MDSSRRNVRFALRVVTGMYKRRQWAAGKNRRLRT